MLEMLFEYYPMETASSLVLQVVAVAVALLVVSVSILMLKQVRDKNLPPGPVPLPFIGSLHLLGKRPHQSLTTLAAKYGPLMSLRLGQKLTIVATSPETAKEFLKVQDANFSSRPCLRATQLLLTQGIALNNITPVFRHLRKILISELTSPKRLQASKHVREEETADMLRAISKQTGVTTIRTHANVVVTNIISRMVLNKRLGGHGDKVDSSKDVNDQIRDFTEILDEIILCFGAIHPQDFFSVPTWVDPQGLEARFRKLRRRMDAFFESVLHQHQEQRRRQPISDNEKTLLDVMLDQVAIPEHLVTLEHLQGIVWDAFVAGTESTLLTVECAMAETLRKPTVMKEAQCELDRVVGSLRVVQESDIGNLKYIQAIVKETLRLHAPLPMLVMHQSASACKAFGYDIPANTRLLVNQWGIARDSQVWENPLEFVPERFLEGAQHARTEFQGQHYEFTPFGSGRRMCVGMTLAVISVQLLVASLLHAFDWELDPEKIDMSEGEGFTVRMHTPLAAIAKPRLAPHLY